jgi:lysophospholipase L1-like esterase
MKRSVRRIARVALVASATLFALALAEAGLRIWYWSQGVGRADVEDLLRQSQLQPSEVHTSELFGIVQPSLFPDVVYELRPKVRGTFREQPYRSNSLGMRGPDVALRKPADVFRIATLGDSHMFGWGVGDGESYVDLLRARNLETPSGRRVELLNFACPGYNAAIEVAVYEHKIRRFHPDLLLVHFVGNDDDWPHFLQPPRRFVPNDWYLTELVETFFARRGLDGELALLPHNLGETDAPTRDAATDHYGYMLGAEGYARSMQRLAELTSADGVPVIVLMLGERPEVAAAIEPLGFDRIDAAPHFARRLAAQLGYELTDANWKGLWDAAYKIPDDGHPTTEAHQAYAAVLADELAKRGYLTR